MQHTNTELIAAIRDELACVANAAKAPAMRAYMKSEMPYALSGRPDVVRRYVREREAVLSPLSRREATKHLN